MATNAAGSSAGQGQYNESYVYNSIGNMTSKGGVTYYYNDPHHKHAVSSTTAGGAFSYDDAGNRVPCGCSRKLTTAGPTYAQTWNAENRLASVTVSGATTNFVYDGNGTLVKKAVVGGQTTVYIGPHYEKNVTTGTVTKYYIFGSRRIAMNQAGVVYWLLGDHPSVPSGQAWAARR